MTKSFSSSRLLLLALGVCGSLLVACGGEDGVRASIGRPINPDEVQERFEAEGIDLSAEEVRFGDPRVDGILLRPTKDDAVRQLGEFRISVLASSRDAEANIRGNPIWKRQGPIYWYREILEQQKFAVAWSAATRYDNVVLGWYPKRRAVDARWHRLDKILRDLQSAQS
jgi:hypothetical protein